MSIYEVEIHRDNQMVQSAKKLEPRPGYNVRHGGLTVPIWVHANDHVDVFLKQMKGNLDDLHVLGFGQGQIWTQERLEKLSQVTLTPKPGIEALELKGTTQNLETYKIVVCASKDILPETRVVDIK